MICTKKEWSIKSTILIKIFYAKSVRNFATPIPKNVPVITPINAINTAIGTNDCEYAAASTGDEATPPIFEREAMPQVNKSSLNTLPIIAIKIP